jgi:hypothetical protein
MSQTIQVLASSTKSGISAKTGKAYEIKTAQAVLTDVTTGEIVVGELPIHRDMELPVPGLYVPQFTATVDYTSKKIIGVLSGLVPQKTASSFSASTQQKPA